jgi:hypothetical protein
MNKGLKAVVLLLLLITTQAPAAVNYTLNQAVKLKLVSYTITGIDTEGRTKNVSSDGVHFGPCMKVVLNNLSKQTLKLSIDAGVILLPFDTSFQRMIVTDNWVAELLPAEKKIETLTAMCGQPFHKSPISTAKYRIGEKVEASILNVVGVIQEMELQNGFGQELLWTALDPTYLAQFRNTADKSPSNAFMALTLNRSGIIGAKEMLRYIPFRPDTLNIRITRRDTTYETYKAIDTLHQNITLRDTVWERNKQQNYSSISKKAIEQARAAAERELTYAFIMGLGLLSFAAGLGGFVVGRMSKERRSLEEDEEKG